MSESISIDKSLSEEEIYESLLPQIKALIVAGEPVISSAANITAALKEAFDKMSWVGFYFARHDTLYLGPFQGKSACTVIKKGKGVCGTALMKKETIIVEDVDNFDGHIACDSSSKSEIVVPLFAGGNVIGVLDADSYSASAFSQTDKFYLEKICETMSGILNLSDFEIQ